MSRPWTPQLGIQLRGFDPDHALRTSPTQGFNEVGSRRAGTRKVTFQDVTVDTIAVVVDD